MTDTVLRPFRPHSHDAPPDAGRFDEEAASLGNRDPAPQKPTRLATICAASFAGQDVPDRPWLIKDMVPDRTVTLLNGDGGTGKSLLAQQLGVAVATGTGWIGHAPKPGCVLYLSAEDDVDEVHRRLADITAGAGLQLEDLADFHIAPLAGKDAVLALPERKSETIAATPLWLSVVDKVEEIEPGLLIIDNLADAFAGNENSRPQARQFIGLLRGLAIERGLAVVLIGHPSLTGISTGTGTSGSTAWSNSVRSRLYLDRAKADDGDEPDPDLRILRVMKANYSPIGTEVRIRWESGRFKLEGGGAGAFDRMAADQRAEHVFLDLLSVYRAQDRDVSEKPSPNFAPTVFAKHPDCRSVSKRALTDAMNRLFTAKKISVETIGPPSRQRRRIVVTE